MQLPLQVVFRNLAPLDQVKTRIDQNVEKLQKFYPRILGCRVVVEVPHRHQRKGNLYQVRIELTVPNGELVIQRPPDRDRTHEDINVALRDAFAAAEQQLKDYAAIQRHEVKVHAGAR